MYIYCFIDKTEFSYLVLLSFLGHEFHDRCRAWRDELRRVRHLLNDFKREILLVLFLELKQVLYFSSNGKNIHSDYILLSFWDTRKNIRSSKF